MPQMMPLSWLSLYFYFIFVLFLFSFINYFSFIPLYSPKKKILSTNSFNWKW